MIILLPYFLKAPQIWPMFSQHPASLAKHLCKEVVKVDGRTENIITEFIKYLISVFFLYIIYFY